MIGLARLSIPSLVRVKPGALDRLGIYLSRAEFSRVALFVSEGLVESFTRRAEAALKERNVEVVAQETVESASFEAALDFFRNLAGACQAVVGLGGGKALDTAKYVAFLAGRPYYALPTSLSNDGFCSPQASLTMEGRRRSFRARLPVGVVLDTEVCRSAPEHLWWSGIGDLVAKVTAVADWKAAFHARGETVDDFAALLSDATVYQLHSHAHRDLEGIRLLGTALMLNGIAMEISGSSRPASGSEHLISHALDLLSQRPRLHGLQVGVAAYLVSRLQGAGTERIAPLLERTGFWEAIRRDPFSRQEWLEAVRRAPTIKPDFYTVLDSRDCLPEVDSLLRDDPTLDGCFVE